MYAKEVTNLKNKTLREELKNHFKEYEKSVKKEMREHGKLVSSLIKE